MRKIKQIGKNISSCFRHTLSLNSYPQLQISKKPSRKVIINGSYREPLIIMIRSPSVKCFPKLVFGSKEVLLISMVRSKDMRIFFWDCSVQNYIGIIEFVRFCKTLRY